MIAISDHNENGMSVHVEAAQPQEAGANAVDRRRRKVIVGRTLLFLHHKQDYRPSGSET